MRMRVKDIKNLIEDKICLYDAADEDFDTLWEGQKKDIPSEYLNAEIRILGAKRKGIVEIGIGVAHMPRKHK